jgi:hypothetical protein
VGLQLRAEGSRGAVTARVAFCGVCYQVLCDEEAAPEKAALLVMLLDRRWVDPFVALFNAPGSVPRFLRKVTNSELLALRILCSHLAPL